MEKTWQKHIHFSESAMPKKVLHESALKPENQIHQGGSRGQAAS